MADRVVLHIGTMKSGTTYLQRVLDTGVLESVGAFYAGGSFKAQAWAVDRLTPRDRRGLPAAWDDLAAKVARRAGVAVISHELLSFAPRAQARLVVDSFEGAPVDVLLTVRDQHTAMPAQWQTFVRNRGMASWDAYVAHVDGIRRGGARRSRRSPALRGFRRAQYVPDILARWAGHGAVAGVGVALVPPPGSPPRLLWQRFCEAAGLEASEPPAEVTRQNESLGYASCELLRRLNGSMLALSRREHERARRGPIQAMLPLRNEEHRPVLDRQGAELARELNRRLRRAVTEDGVRLAGSLDDLPVTDRGTAPESIPPPDPEELRCAVETVWARCLPGIPQPFRDLDGAVAELGRRLTERFGP